MTVEGQQGPRPRLEAPRRKLVLLVEPEPWGRTFLRNLRDVFRPSRSTPAEVRRLYAWPGKFWDDVFVHRPLPKRGLVDSYLGHILFVLSIVGLSQAGWFFDKPVVRRDPFQNTHIEYYNVSEYLPPVDTSEPAPKAAPAQPKARIGAPPAPPDPVYAKQEVISVPPDPDNLSQTIVTPKLGQINRHIDLPNIVSTMPELAPQPIIVPRAVAKPKIADVEAPKLIVPKAILKIDARKQLPRLQINATADTSTSKLADALEEPVPALKANDAPKLEAPAQAAAAGAPASGNPDAGVAMPAITSNHGAQIIALSTHPVDPKGSLDVPNGSRRGSFAAGPTGQPDASGAPATSPSNGGPGGGTGTGGSGGKTGLPPGITVGPSPGPAVPNGSVVASPSNGKPPAPDASVREKFMAALRNPSGNIPPPRPSTGPAPEQEKNESPEDKKLANSVFGPKRYYTLTLNAPNLTSATGSWVVRFAELKPVPGHSGELTPPSATSKADPAYPPELMHDRVEGTVVLYAVIRADGSITDVRVINSIHEQLDANAIKALRRWHFLPGSKNGQPVDVEAIVQIPFKARRIMF